MLFQCKVCGPATDRGSAPSRAGKAKPWRTIDIHCHCMVPEANAMVLKATGIPGGGETLSVRPLTPGRRWRFAVRAVDRARLGKLEPAPPPR